MRIKKEDLEKLQKEIVENSKELYEALLETQEILKKYKDERTAIVDGYGRLAKKVDFALSAIRRKYKVRFEVRSRAVLIKKTINVSEPIELEFIVARLKGEGVIEKFIKQDNYYLRYEQVNIDDIILALTIFEQTPPIIKDFIKKDIC